MSKIWAPTSIWVIRYGGLLEDPDVEPVCLTTTAKYEAMRILERISQEFERRFPGETWFEDIIDAKGKTKFRKEMLHNPRIFVTAEKTDFIEAGYRRLLPGIDRVTGHR